ncbi:MAG: hypothetical protein HFJ54_02335 [Clostridia bacterium]|nr:hypothetical protein [Clostridia bacterium]
MIIDNEYSQIIIPNPTKEVFIVTKEDGSTEVLNAKKERIFKDLKNVSGIEISRNSNKSSI